MSNQAASNSAFKYGFGKALQGSFEQAVEKTKDALKAKLETIALELNEKPRRVINSP